MNFFVTAEEMAPAAVTLGTLAASAVVTATSTAAPASASASAETGALV